MPPQVEVGCAASESFGRSEYWLSDQSGIQHYVYDLEYEQFTLARVIKTSGAVSLCTTYERALIFVIPGKGVFQIDRRLDTPEEPILLAPVPEHFGPETSFKLDAGQLWLVTGHLATEISFEIQVRNDDLPTIAPHSEISEVAFAQLTNAELAPSLALESNRLYIRDQPELLLKLEQEPVGICQGPNEFAVFDSVGGLIRLNVSNNPGGIETLGHFAFDSPVQVCVIDESQQRLYALTRSPMIWVFDLNESGLGQPRAVTSNQIVEDLVGLSLYGNRFLISQSSGDHSFVVFATEDMKLVGQFRVVADVSRGIDGVTFSNWLRASSSASPELPAGYLLIRDTLNQLPDGPENLKLIDWRDIQSLIQPD